MATNWPEAVPLCSVTAKSIARELMALFSRTGIPRELLTDQLVSKLCAGLGVDKLPSSPYRLESNGLIERMHKTLGAILRKCASQGRDCAALLQFAMFALHYTPNRDTLLSPLELLLW